MPAPIEREVKAVVGDWAAAIAALRTAGAVLEFEGRLEDRRYDTATGDLLARDHVLRLRAYRDAAGGTLRVSIDWKGPTESRDGFKLREELSTPVGDPAAGDAILRRLGYAPSVVIDRTIAQYRLGDTVVRLERYPRMDDLVEVEGSAEGIERAVRALGLPRTSFTGESLPAFVDRFETRTGTGAALSDAEAAGLAQDHRRA